jgi:hypothetical protein
MTRIVGAPSVSQFGARLLVGFDRLNLAFTIASNDGQGDRHVEQTFFPKIDPWVSGRLLVVTAPLTGESGSGRLTAARQITLNGGGAFVIP